MSTKSARFTEHWDAIDPFDTGYPHLWIKIEHLGRYQFAAAFLKAAGVNAVADIACGRGYGSAELARNAMSVLAIERDPELLRYAREHHRASGVTYRQSDVQRSGLSAALASEPLLDALVSFETIEHLVDPGAVLQSFGEIMVPGGYLIISVPNSEFEQVDDLGLLFNRQHRRSFSVSGIIELLQGNGFDVQEVLGQPLVAEIARNEARLIRRKLLCERGADEPELHSGRTVRRLAMTVAWPQQRDVERSYAITIVAVNHRSGSGKT